MFNHPIVCQRLWLIFHAVGFGDFSDYPAWNSCGKAPLRNIPGHYAACANYAVVSDRYAGTYGHRSAKPAIVADLYRFCVTEACYLIYLGGTFSTANTSSAPGPAHRIGKVIFHGFQCGLFQPADLGLGDLNLLGHLHLGFSLKETKLDNIVFPFPQALHGVV